MAARTINPSALDQPGFKGAGLYNFTHPAVPFGHRIMWAARAEDGSIEISEGDGEPIVARLTDEEFRNARDWPVPIGSRHVLIGSASVDTASRLKFTAP